MPESRLVDTSVLSLVLKRDTRAAAYVPHLAGHVGSISFITLAELYRWPEERGWGPRRRADLKQLLERYRVVYPDDALCRRWAMLVAAARRAGRPPAVRRFVDRGDGPAAELAPRHTQPRRLPWHRGPAPDCGGARVALARTI